MCRLHGREAFDGALTRQPVQVHKHSHAAVLAVSRSVRPGSGGWISAPTPSGTLETQTTATVGCTTDQNTGTLYVVVDSAANMAGITDAQIIAGTNANDASPVFDGSAAISTTSPSVGATGLTANTAYAYAIVQDNDNGESNVVTGTFTTAEEAAQEVDGDGNFSVALSTAQAGTGQAAARKLRLTEANELELRPCAAMLGLKSFETARSGRCVSVEDFRWPRSVSACIPEWRPVLAI